MPSENGVCILLHEYFGDRHGHNLNKAAQRFAVQGSDTTMLMEINTAGTKEISNVTQQKDYKKNDQSLALFPVTSSFVENLRNSFFFFSCSSPFKNVILRLSSKPNSRINEFK